MSEFKRRPKGWQSLRDARGGRASRPRHPHDPLLVAWQTNCRVTADLVGRIPAGLWAATLPGTPTRTIRSLAAHLHNARCRWIRTLGSEHGVRQPERVDQRTVTPRRLLTALRASGRGIGALLELGDRRGGQVPPSTIYVWRNLALDTAHVLTYFVAHEAHHRGQIVMAARQLGLRLPPAVTAGLWQWRTRRGEADAW